MLSRTAESVYWMSRYIERAENTARFVEVNLTLMLDLTTDQHKRWEPLIYITGDHEVFFKRYEVASRENVIHFLTFDLEYPNSILSSMIMARENARHVREIITTEMWERLNTLYLSLKEASSSNYGFDNLSDLYSHIKKGSQLFLGTTDATMSHGDAWHFARLGRLFERADKTSRIVDIKYFILLPNAQDVGAPIDNIQWAALLDSVSGHEMYRKQYGRITPNEVAEFLILDQEFPRSIHYCLVKAEESMHNLSGSPMGSFSNPAEQFMGRLRSELDYTTITDIVNFGLHEYLDSFQSKLNRLGGEVQTTFFTLEPIETAMSQRQTMNSTMSV